MDALFPTLPGLADYSETVRAITQAANELLFRVVEDVMNAYSDGQPQPWSPRAVQAECRGFQESLVRERNAFVERNQTILLQALEEDVAPRTGRLCHGPPPGEDLEVRRARTDNGPSSEHRGRVPDFHGAGWADGP